MLINESIVENAATEWFWGLGYQIGYGSPIAPGEPTAEWDSFGAVVLVASLREAIWRLNSVILSCSIATVRETLRRKLRSGDLSVSRLGKELAT